MAHHEVAPHGLNLPRDPRAGDLQGGPPEQTQAWPGSDRGLRPAADHGEQSYRGGNKLAGLTALITGGDSGIGRAVAIAFAREGADVAIAYYDEEEDARETVRWIEDAGRKALAIPGDLRDREHCRRCVERTRSELGGLNILVNNASVHFETQDFQDIPPDRMDQVFRTNIYAYIWLAQAAAKHMDAGDVIINTGSVQELEPNPALMDYAATKAAAENLTKSLAVALAERGIRVNCVAPGPVWTPLIPATRIREKVGRFGASTLWKRPAQPAEIAPAYVFLASADARYFTAEVLCPSGTPTTTR